MQITLSHAMGMNATALGADIPPPPTNPITALSAQGWRATYPSAGDFDPEGAPQAVTVTRSGFDATGTPTTHNDALRVMARVRQPYPDQGTLSTDQVALSDFVYGSDTLAGAQNNSTRAYPKPIATWLNHDYERATASTHTLRLAVAHAHGRDGRPVAAVKFIASDSVNTAEQTVAAMSTISYDASGLTVPHFAADLDLSGLDQGAVLTIDAVIYPWVGEAFTISTDADAYPSPNLTTLRLLNDRTGGFGAAYAYVDPVGGDNATGAASSTASTARAAPFLTLLAAKQAAMDINHSVHGRAADESGIVIRLEEGTTVLSTNIRVTSQTSSIPVVIEAADPTKVATTILSDRGTSLSSGAPRKLLVRNITLRKTANVVFLDVVNGLQFALTAVDCIWDRGASGYYTAWINRIGIFTQINCAITANGNPGHNDRLGTASKAGNAIGSQGSSGTAIYSVVGCSDLSSYAFKTAAGSNPSEAGTLFGWNTLSNGSSANPLVQVEKTVGARGIAVVGNVIESWGSHFNAALKINADGNVSPTQNVVIAQNSIVGQRLNFLYMDTSSNVEKAGYVRGNVFQTMNIKGDVFAQQTANTGNWPVRYKTGWSHNVALSGSNNGNGYSPTSWMGEIASLGEGVGVDPDWVDDRSNMGSDVGGGDYTPGVSTALPTIPTGIAAYPVDLFGRAIVPGTAHIGAVQRP